MNKTGKETLAYRSLRCFKQVLNYKLQKGKKNYARKNKQAKRTSSKPQLPQQASMALEENER